jgi:Protein of unknown function (DUF1569)
MKNLFDPNEKNEILERIEKLTPNTERLWGKMDVAQMLAHCNVPYELVYEAKHPKPNKLVKFFLKLFVKETVVGEKPYPKNGPTAPVFLIKSAKNFDDEKKRLIDHINKTQELGEKYFEGRESHSFGPLSKAEWNVMFSKHLEHHLNQFGV